MKRGLLVLGIVVLLGTGSAEAALSDWPVIKQTIAIGSCVLADTGSIGQSAITHAIGFVADVGQIVEKCTLFVIDQVTPDFHHE